MHSFLLKKTISLELKYALIDGSKNAAPAGESGTATTLEDEPEPDTTLFVKNLNFSTTDETLRQHFASCGAIFSATVARKKDPKNPGQLLSMGYGFVQFCTRNSTTTALKELQNSKLDDHVIELKVRLQLKIYERNSPREYGKRWHTVNCAWLMFLIYFLFTQYVRYIVTGYLVNSQGSIW